MASTTATVRSLPEDYSIEIRVCLSRPLRFRLWVAVQILKVASAVIGNGGRVCVEEEWTTLNDRW